MKHKIFLPLLLGGMLAGCAGTGVGVSYYSSTPPPPIRVERYGPAPGPDYVWINGYWGLNSGSYNWMPGRWERRPRPHSQWVEPRWEKKGNRYRLRQGHWK